MNFNEYLSPLSIELVQSYLASKTENKCKSTTNEEYLREINLYAGYLKKDILDVSVSETKNYINSLLNSRSPKTVYKKYMYLLDFNCFLLEKHADKLPHGFRNNFVFVAVEEPSKIISPDRIISNEDFNQLMTYIHTTNERDYLIFMLIYTSGLTVSQVCKLKNHQVIAYYNTGYFQFEKKDDLYYAKIIPEVKQLLDYYMAKYPSSIFIFETKKGQAITPRAIQYSIKKFCQEAGLEKTYTPNDLRHSGAVHGLMHGAPKAAIKKQFNIKHDKYLDRYDVAVSTLEGRWLCDYIEVIIKYD